MSHTFAHKPFDYVKPSDLPERGARFDYWFYSEGTRHFSKWHRNDSHGRTTQKNNWTKEVREELLSVL
jgi:hypothetical protein